MCVLNGPSLKRVLSFSPGRHCTPYVSDGLMLQVRWQGWDSEGRPVLVVRIAKASEECSGAQADAVATAVISQVCACGLTAVQASGVLPHTPALGSLRLDLSQGSANDRGYLDPCAL